MKNVCVWLPCKLLIIFSFQIHNQLKDIKKLKLVVLYLTLLKLGQNFDTVSIPERGLRNKKSTILGNVLRFNNWASRFSCPSSEMNLCSLSKIANACWTVLFCPLFASILARKSRFSSISSIPAVETWIQLFKITVDNVYKSYLNNTWLLLI